jgi:tyrosyl-tRNA synthetase
MDAKKNLAEEITARYYGIEIAKSERKFFEDTFSKKQLPDLEVTGVKLEHTWSRILADQEWVGSRKEAQRLIAQGGLKINGEPVKEDIVGQEMLKEVFSIQIGKHKFMKLRFLIKGDNE